MEAQFRKRISDVLGRIDHAFEDVDPDLAECELIHGSLTLIFKDGSKCILSSQPSVEQLWLALASRGIAIHFNFDETQQKWFDDKGKGIELYAFLQTHLKESLGIDVLF